MSRLMIVEVPSYTCEFKGIREVCELVRCRECIHWKQAPKTDKGWCDRLDGLLEPTWYCADGERNSNE